MEMIARVEDLSSMSRKYGRHFHELTHVRYRNFGGSGLDTKGNAHHEILDAFQVGGGLQAGKQLTSASLVDAGDGSRQTLINLALNQIEFLVASSMARMRCGKNLSAGGSWGRIARNEARL